jgi:hypothetical protein
MRKRSTLTGSKSLCRIQAHPALKIFERRESARELLIVHPINRRRDDNLVTTAIFAIFHLEEIMNPNIVYFIEECSALVSSRLACSP